MAGRKQGPGLPFTPWDQIKIGLDPSSKLPENFQKSVASISVSYTHLTLPTNREV